jgi:TolB-like protein
MKEDHFRQPKRASDAAIRSQVDKILASDGFAGSNKLNQLLVFLVDQALEGHSLNEYSIAMDVFRKDDSFDPRIDPIVRVYVRRLRNKLNEYRTTAGLHDPIEIELPPRTYVPRIRVRPRPMPFRLPNVANAARTVVVRPFRHLSSEGPDEYFCEGLVEEIIHAMAKIKHLRIIPVESLESGRNASTNFRELCEKLRVEAILNGNVRKGADKLRVAAHLTNAADGSVIWAEIYERHVDDAFANQLFAIQEEIAHAIVTALWAGRELAPPEQPLHIPAENLKDIAIHAGIFR